MNFEEKLEEFYVELPEPPTPIGLGVNVSRAGKILFVGGALPLSEGRIMKGRVGVEVRTDTANKAARAAAMNALSIIRNELGGTLNKVRRIVQMSVMVACGTEFKDHFRVLDGASDLINQIFGASGKHTRTAFGVISLPENAIVELSMVVEVR